MSDPVFSEFWAALTQLEGAAIQPTTKADYKRWFGQMPNRVAFLVTAHILAECRRRPSVAEINDIRRAIELGDIESNAAIALAQVHETYKRFRRRPVQDGYKRGTFVDLSVEGGIGYTAWEPNMVDGMPDFTDPSIPLTIESMGGWSSVCDLIESHSQVYWGKQFVDMYKAAKMGDANRTLQSLNAVYRELRLADGHGLNGTGEQIPGQRAIPGIGALLECIALRPAQAHSASTEHLRVMIPIQRSDVSQRILEAEDE